MTLEQLKRRSKTSSSGKITFKPKEVKELIDKLEVLEILKEVSDKTSLGNWAIHISYILESSKYEKVKKWLEK